MKKSFRGENYDLFKSIFDDADNGICIVDYEGFIVELNNLYAEMFGYQKEDLIDKHYSVLISDDYQAIVKKNHYKIFNGTSFLKAEEKVCHKNGTSFYVQTSNVRVNDEFGNKLRITTTVDISNRLKNELIQSVLLKISNLTNLNTPNEKLFASIHQFVCQLIPARNFSVCIKNKISGKIEFPFVLNENYDEDHKALQAENKLFSKVGHAAIFDSTEIQNYIANNELNTYEITPRALLGIPLIIKNEILGSIIIKNYNGTTYTKDDQELLELVAGQVARVVERKNYEDELIYARNKAEEAAKIKSEFLAQISHEIRTPLNSILSFSSLIKNELNGELTEELAEAFEYIERGGHRLTRTIDLILNVSKSKNNKYKIKLEEIDLMKQLLKPLVKEFENSAENKKIELKLEETDEVLRLVCDQYSLNQLFSNLIENAIKYTPAGNITIKSYKNDFGNVQVDVMDTGIGIANEFLPKLFEPFSQEEQGYTRTYEGIGLGLSLVKSYAELNSAEIKVSSKKDIGSVFSVIFN